MLSSSLRRNAGNSSLKDLKKSLLYTLSGYITGNGCVFSFSGDLVNLININDSVLCPLNVIVSCLDDLQKDIFHILSYISGFCQGGGISDCKRNVQKAGQSLSQKSFSGTCWAKHQNIAFLKLHIQISCCGNSFIMIINCHRQSFFCILLSDYIIIQDFVDFLWFQKVDIRVKIILRTILGQLLFHNLRTDSDAFITDEHSLRACDQLPYLILGFITKRASDLSFSYLICHGYFSIPFYIDMLR